jgi:DNA adenine methylase
MEKSFLRWAGSKQKLLGDLSSYWQPTSKRYIEPFMGSAKLYFRIKPEAAILSDINSDLVETFNRIKINPRSVFNIIKRIRPDKDTYYKMRSLDPFRLGVNQRAARFIYLNQLCFNGLYRTNLKGQFNVPYSGLNKLDYEGLFFTLQEASRQLAGATILCSDFQQVIFDNARPNDFFYIDPPFAVQNRRIFNQYGPHTFGLNDLIRLQNAVTHIDKKGAKFLLSYAYCKEALEIFKSWNMKKRFTQRNISGFSEFRRKAAELFITNIN